MENGEYKLDEKSMFCKYLIVTYWVYSILILALGKREMVVKALLDMRRVSEHEDLAQESTTLTSILPPLHGLLFPLTHLTLYLLPHAAPLSHNPSFTATNRFPGGNCFLLFPPQAVAAQLIKDDNKQTIRRN